MARSRLVSALGLAGVAAGVVVGVAGAVIVPSIPNTSFEQPPPGCDTLTPPLPLTAICGWNDLVGTMTQDSSEHHTGSFSMKITGPNDPSGVEATTVNGVCISPVSPGPHAASFWYLTSSPVDDVQFGADWYPNADCSVASDGSNALHAPTPLTYGAWTQVTGFLTTKSNTGSAFFFLFAKCQQCTQPVTITAYFDDVSFESSTAATLVSLTAARSRAGVLLRWRMGTEADTLGFHVYRERGRRRIRVDRQLIAGKGSIAGGRYSFLDRRAPKGAVSYRLQAVETNGSRTWYGPVSVSR